MNAFHRGSPCEDRTKSILRVPEEPYDNTNDDTVLIKYNRTLLFPLKRWIQMNTCTKITHKKKDELKKLSLKVSDKWILSGEPSMQEVWEHIVRPIKNTVLHLWDVQGEIRPWLARKMCNSLMGVQSTETLPKANMDAYDRSKNYTGVDSLDMISANTESAVMGLEKAYTEEDIEKARKNNQGRIEYEHNTEKYMNPENLI